MSHEQRYLVITELFLPTKGGTAVWFDEAYRRLGGKAIHIVTADVPGARAHDALQPNTIHRLRLKRYPFLKPESALIYLRLLLRTLRLALSKPFDAIHAGRVLPEGLVGAWVARFTQHPLVIYAHGEEITCWREPRKFKAMVATYHRAQRIIANSEFTRQELLKIGIDAARIAVIYPGVDIERFHPGLPCNDLRQRLKLTAEQKLILSVGRLSRRKGFDQVIQALPALIAQGLDVHYVLIGTGEDKEYLLTLARTHQIAERVHLLGHVPSDELPRWYNACDVFAMPNRQLDGDTEGFGMVFLEAAACAKPVVAGQDGGTADAVLDGVTGWRVDGSDLSAVTDALGRLLQDPQLAQRLGSQGHARTLRDFAWESVAEKTRALAVPPR